MTQQIAVADLALPRMVNHFVDRSSVEYLELVNSIRAIGVLNPLVVRLRKDSKPAIIDGVWRLAVAQELGLTSLPCSVVDVDDLDALLMAANLNADHRPPGDFAPFLRGFMRYHPEVTMAGLVQRLCKSPSWVIECLSLHFLDNEVQTMVLRGEMPLQSAYYLAKLRSREHFVDLARVMPAAQFKTIITAAIRSSQGERRDFLNRRANPTEFKPRTWLRPLNDFRSEFDTSGNGLRQVTDSMTPLDGWQAAIRWALNIDPSGIERQRVKYERQRR